MMLSAIERLTPGCFYQFLLTRFGQCRFVQVGEQLSKLVGLPLTALMEDANSFFSLLNAECRQAVMQKLAESAARGAEFATCDKFIRPDNKVVWLETRSIPEVQANGDIIWTGFVYDVTSREQALYELNELASTSKAILDNLLDAVITIIPTGCIDFANQTALKLFGYNAEQLIGQNISCLMAGQHAKNHNDYLSHYMLTRDARSIGAKRVVEAVDSEKNVIPVELRICELHSEKGLRFLGVIRDLRAKQQQQKQIEQLTHVDPLTGLPNRLALQRELIRLRSNTPKLPYSVPKLQQIAAKLTQLGFYGLLIVMPLSGYLMQNAAGRPLELFGLSLPSLLNTDLALYGLFREIHGLAALLLVPLLVVHIIAALYHGLIKRDGVFSSMVSK